MKIYLLQLVILMSLSLNLQAQNLSGTIRGKVTCHGKGLQGVVVTDGIDCVLTNKSGEYVLAPQRDARFVYLSVPSGYQPKTEKTIPNSDNGNSWAMNNNCLDARTFNNAQYLVLVSTAHFPQWGGTPYLYMYDVTSDGSFTGTVSTSDALTFNPSLSSFGSADGVAATGDVLLAPTTDGYKLRLYYVDNNCKIIGGYEFDCIDK